MPVDYLEITYCNFCCNFTNTSIVQTQLAYIAKLQLALRLHRCIGSNFSRQASGTKFLVQKPHPLLHQPHPCHSHTMPSVSANLYTLVLSTILDTPLCIMRSCGSSALALGCPTKQFQTTELKPQSGGELTSVWFNSLYMHRVHTPATQLPVQYV